MNDSIQYNKDNPFLVQAVQTQPEYARGETLLTVTASVVNEDSVL